VVTEREIDDAAAVLREGGLVAFPTETVYGLGADAENSAAIERLYAVKGRPRRHPVIVHLGAPDALDAWARHVPDAARRLAAACWPGPLALVVERAGHVPDAITGGRETVAVRVPDQPVARSLLDAFGGGIAAPSANRFGRVSPTTAQDVRADLGIDVDRVLDGGPCRVGVESTIVDCSGARPAILRLGAVAQGRVEQVLGAPVELRTRGEVAAPGTLASHYAPDARVVVVDAGAVAARATSMLAAGERVGLLSLESIDGLPEGLVVLDAPGDIDDYAHVLYARLREADRLGLDVILTVAPPADGIGAAVADRLARAGQGS
jgi:L-threonylcarbamoyladenylate synthase